MRIDFEHLLDNEIQGIENLDETVEVRYPTGCVDLTKKEILAKLCEIEFKLTATWTHEFLDDLEQKYRYMDVYQLAKELCNKLQEIYDWDESVYEKVLG